MKNIKILGTGCQKCKQNAAVVEAAIKETGIDATAGIILGKFKLERFFTPWVKEVDLAWDIKKGMYR